MRYFDFSSFKIEEKFVLLCAFPQKNAQEIDFIRTLVLEIQDWDYVLKLASIHGITSLLWHNIKQNYKDIVSQDIRQRFRSYWQGNVIYAFKMSQELCKILQLLQQHSIQAIPLKGPVLAELYYGNMALREYCDLDILVPEAEVLDAKKILVSCGYEETIPISKGKNVYLKASHHFKLCHPSHKISVELHWKLLENFMYQDFSNGLLYKNTVHQEFSGHKVCCLSPEDTLLYLCLHGSKHFWQKILWLVDIAMIVQSRQDWDWEKILQNASKTGTLRRMLVALFLVQRLWEIPVSLLCRLKMAQDKSLSALAKQICQHFLFLFTQRTWSSSIFRAESVSWTKEYT